MTTKVPVSGSVLRWALERSGKSSEIQSKFPKLHEWLEGKSLPTMRNLERLAKATYTPFGYFFLSDPPEEQLPIPHFRTVDAMGIYRPSPDFLESVQTMQMRQDWMREYLIEEGQAPLSFVKSAPNKDEPRKVAQRMREVLGLDQGWANKLRTWTMALETLVKKIEEAGILVVINGVVGNNTHRKLDVKEFRGFVLVDEYAPLVFVNGADSKAAQMFTLAHELAHIWFGTSAAFDLRELRPATDKTEQACDKVAAEFLVPGDDFLNIWSSVCHMPNLYDEIARKFKVSSLVAARRALDLKLINGAQFKKFYNGCLERSVRVQGQTGGNFYATQDLRLGRRFAKAVVRAVVEERLLYYEAYKLTGLYGKTFAEYAKKLGFKDVL